MSNATPLAVLRSDASPPTRLARRSGARPRASRTGLRASTGVVPSLRDERGDDEGDGTGGGRERVAFICLRRRGSRRRSTSGRGHGRGGCGYLGRVEEMLGGMAFHCACIGRAVAPLEG